MSVEDIDLTLVMALDYSDPDLSYIKCDVMKKEWEDFQITFNTFTQKHEINLKMQYVILELYGYLDPAYYLG